MILNYYPRRVLVLGASGFVGERVCLRLRRAGVEVVALLREPDAPVARGLRAAGCQVRRGDTTRRWTLWEAMEGCEAVISCAPIGTANAVVQGCNRVGLERLVCLSSTRRYSRVRDASVEEVERGEVLVSQSELQWTILRPTMIFGALRDNNLARVMDWMRRRAWFPVFGDGRAKVQPVFVEDVVSAATDVLRRPHTIGRSYTLAGPDAMEWRALLAEVAVACDREVRLLHLPLGMGLLAADLLGKRLNLTRENVLRQQENRAFEIEDARRDLGFDPRPFETTVRLMASGAAEVERIYPAVAERS
ncbi:MAG: NAD(P)H-binding protein [Candidatus Sumerlaeia bacterium]|nr:NAD(P)H-binding protein [Candidatus Sumerlaeia bacterium]